MDGIFFTLQEYFAYTKSITYILMAVTLIGLAGFWIFLVEKDEDN